MNSIIKISDLLKIKFLKLEILKTNVIQKCKNSIKLPSSSSLISLAAWMPSSLRFRSIRRLRAAAARSSADCAHPIMRIASVQNVLDALVGSAKQLGRNHRSGEIKLGSPGVVRFNRIFYRFYFSFCSTFFTA